VARGAYAAYIAEAGAVDGFSTPLESLVRPAVDHQWLSRPIGRNAKTKPDRFYPYGSTGRGKYQVHHGVEFVSPLGTEVTAAADGTVVVAGTDDEYVWGRHLDYYGQLVVIRLARNYGRVPVYVLYGHLDRVHVRIGQQVYRGQSIGIVGMQGVALGPHLHFEVRVAENDFAHTRNPELWLESLPGYGTIVGRIEDGRGQNTCGTLVTFRPVEHPDRYWREAWTYACARAEHLGPDEAWHENFVMGDVPAGEYIVRTRIDGRFYADRVSVEPGTMAFVSLVALPFDDVLDVDDARKAMEP
jgi:murein DD-endopeptidase MepM/ murein hydrolase activator NlpD